MNPRDFVTVGKIVGVHGLKGGVKAKAFTDSDAFFRPGNTVDLRGSDGRRHNVTIAGFSGGRWGLLLHFKEVTDRNLAQTLVGADIVVARKVLPETAPDEYYWHDLIGLKVYDKDRYLGEIAAVIPTGGNDVYVVHGRGGEKLIPALASVVVKIDRDSGLMRVNLPEGL